MGEREVPLLANPPVKQKSGAGATTATLKRAALIRKIPEPSPKPPSLNLLLPHSPKSNSPLRKRPSFKASHFPLRDSPVRCVIAHGKQKLCWGGWGGEGYQGYCYARFSPSLYLPTSWSAGRRCLPKFPSNSNRTSRPGQLTPSQWETTG